MPTTPLIMLSLLIGPFLLTRVVGKAETRALVLSANLGVCFLFVFTGIGHFVKTADMTQMFPDWVPWRAMLVYVSGVFEICVGAAVLVPSCRRPAGRIILMLLVAFLPLNIYAAANQVGPGGHVLGLGYLLLRVPLQFLIAGWVYWFSIRAHRRDRNAPASASASL